MERATRADVAKAAGVAPSTVSLVLNGRGKELKIAEATISRVKAAALRLNYIPNAAARSLRSGNSHLIALLMAALPDDPFVPVVHTVLTTAMIEIQRRGYLLIPLFQSSEEATDAEVIRALISDTPLAGVIRETTSAEQFANALLADMGIPVVGMSMIETEDVADTRALIRIDESAGVDAILDRFDPPSAHRSHAIFLAGPNTNHSRQNPLFTRYGERAEMISLPDWEAATAHRACLDLLSRDPLIELIFCSDDSQTPGVFTAAEELRIPVPERLSILGFGNNERRSAGDSRLTTVDWPLREMTEAAVDALITIIEAPRTARRVTTIPTSPVWGASVRLTH
ncbi:MAG: LacI family DNA-binding transcriptional regulator [Schaalia hyovaginalis]|uniref:LacI family DNA-binding transcriptional regulator n=1 Tax=Schaalia TaxID=2529408 RepID=UPI0012B2C996|nr:LacI family DNA-binding transcriptional regulator [Schaalia hyovaginalis]MCF2711786.1 LacI family DNA-binding transcriptional regulator [Schaalia hyovaginalis]MCI6410870.1 LacI family transcriptional regulator [Schaalia hyovaginalis]MCI6557164.1 LacI family transcriptional regulator [Schaalia hyovaginalis]MCI7513443.1 LacI family transcriptional regulator [Schaalia hyovaginalis]MDY3664832.1 LacI family DNA-binding transcriptional regulator [Schaalia hyovaginalis]